jgi:hypothetical protein
MFLADVNVLVYAHRRDAHRHESYRRWLEVCVTSVRPFGMSEQVLSSFVRIVTHPGIYRFPTPVEEALRFASSLRDQPNCIIVAPGARHWEIFADLCRGVQAKGSLITDTYFAALAIESGCEWITTDRDYSRFPGLRWRHPLD